MPKPRTAAGYHADQAQHVRATCLDGPPAVTVDFLIDPGDSRKRGGTIWNLESTFAAIVAPGLRLAFLDQLSVPLSGRTIRGERAARDVWVCGPGAFVVLKSLAFRLRGENKDVYDLVYVLQHFGETVNTVAAHLQPLLGYPEVRTALRQLDEDFVAIESVGPMRYATFVAGVPDDELQADAFRHVRELLRLCR